MDDDNLLMIILAFVIGFMLQGMMKNMCGSYLVEGTSHWGNQAQWDACAHGHESKDGDEINNNCGYPCTSVDPKSPNRYCIEQNCTGVNEPYIGCNSHTAQNNLGDPNTFGGKVNEFIALL